jgi:hypothetical protein
VGVRGRRRQHILPKRLFISQETKYLNTAVRISNPKISLNTLFINSKIENNKDKSKFTLENDENDNIFNNKKNKNKEKHRNYDIN